MRPRTGLDGTPVVWLPLHSMLGPAAAGALAAGAARVAYVMTDGAALPGGLLPARAHRCARRGCSTRVVSAGQAFGGDLESVNVFTGLLAAQAVAGADVIVVGDGPGEHRDATPPGARAPRVGDGAERRAILEGRPVAALRIWFADDARAHRGVSHHSITALARVAMAPVHVAVPALADDGQRDGLGSASAGVVERPRWSRSPASPRWTCSRARDRRGFDGPNGRRRSGVLPGRGRGGRAGGPDGGARAARSAGAARRRRRSRPRSGRNLSRAVRISESYSRLCTVTSARRRGRARPWRTGVGTQPRAA